jgi:hypothetical protein
MAMLNNQMVKSTHPSHSCFVLKGFSSLVDPPYVNGYMMLHKRELAFVQPKKGGLQRENSLLRCNYNYNNCWVSGYIYGKLA